MLDNVIVLLNLVFVRANIFGVEAEYWGRGCWPRLSRPLALLEPDGCPRRGARWPSTTPTNRAETSPLPGPQRIYIPLVTPYKSMGYSAMLQACRKSQDDYAPNRQQACAPCRDR
jgi:hypothetical protein